jgi:1,4-alpha-glucan branching enzyme
MIRLATFATNGGGYLNFMGNEFGHPEWIDFPREGNNWSYKYARRQWHLADNKELRYHWLGDFDKAMIELADEKGFLKEPWCNMVLDNQGDQILAFERSNLLFVFNFNPNRSFKDYGIQTHPGKHTLLLNTDSPKFGGFGNIDETVTYMSERIGGVSGQNWLKLYLPPRTAIVLMRRATPTIY